MKAAKIGTIKYIRREGDCREDYKVGDEITFKWHKRWKILQVKVKNLYTGSIYTSIKLEKVKDF